MATIKSDKYTDVPYANGVVIDNENILHPVMETLRMPVDGVKFYGDSLIKVMSLERCAISFYFWSIMEMSDSMIASIDKYQRERFIKFASLGGVDYKDVTVYKAIKNIIDSKLFIKMTSTRCKVNPEYCYRGPLHSRRQQVKVTKRINVVNKKYKVNESSGEINKK